jgi:transposase-like protein
MQWNNVEELFKQLKRNQINNEEDLQPFLINNDNLTISEDCECGRNMKERRRTIEYIDIRCAFCDKSKRIRFLKNKLHSRLDTVKVLRFLLYFTLDASNGFMEECLEISNNTINSLVLELQSKISNILFETNEMIGGLGHIVQLDESCFGKRKYNVGRNGNQVWVFGGIDTTTGSFFARIVPNRKVETLGPVIRSFVIPQTTVHTDEHASYISFFNNNTQYLYDNVNHKTNFVNPVTGTHTQNIENLWSQFKKFKRRKGYSKLQYLSSYLDEFRLRNKFNKETR